MNYVAIIAGAITVMVLGWIWFHPKVFGKSWRKGVGLTEEDTKSVNPMIMIGAFLMAAFLSYSISRFSSHTEEGMSQFVHGMYHGFLPAKHFVIPILVSKGLFEQKSLGWIFLSTLYWVLAMMLVGGVTYSIAELFPVAAVAG